MFARAPKAVAMAGMIAAMALAAPASAQSNPFVPASGASKAQVETIVDQKLEALRAEIASLKNAQPAGPVPGGPVPGVPGGPVGAVPGSDMSGAAVPGSMGPPGAMVPGMPGAMMEAPKGAVETARSSGVRFLGCINGEAKFVKTTGERVSFTAKEISEAVKAGFVPACR